MPLWNLGQRTKLRRSRQAEERVARTLGGKTLPGSGSVPFAPGHSSLGADVRTARFLVEHKRTDTTNLVLQCDWLTKIDQNAIRSARNPALVFEVQFDPPWVLLKPPDALAAGVDPTAITARITLRRTVTLTQGWLRTMAGSSPPHVAVETPYGVWYGLPLELAKESMTCEL